MSHYSENDNNLLRHRPEVKAIHRKTLRRRRLSKGFTYLVAILILLWIVVPFGSLVPWH